jgi:oligosaccharide repeat unit polymerase
MSSEPFSSFPLLLQEVPEPPKLRRVSFVFFAFFVIGLLALYAHVDGRINTAYSSLHFVIIGISSLHLMWVRRYNMGASFSLFTLIFFGIIPLFEYRLGITYNGAPIPRDSSYMEAAEIVLMSCGCFYLGYGLKRDKGSEMDLLKRLRFASRKHRQIVTGMAIGTLGICAFAIAAFYEFSLHNIMLRGYGEEVDQSAIGNAFITYVARPLYFDIVLIMILHSMHRERKPYVWVFLLGCSALLFVSPIGIPRNLVGALYIPLLMLAFLPRYNSKYAVIGVILFAILLAAPLVDVFRHINLHEDVDLGENYNLDYLFSGHFDAFHNLTQVIDLDYRSKGFQVIGILLFWVPRALWEGKPQGTSFDFADYAGYEAHNVSFPLQAEFYVDYGVIGVAIGMFFTGVLYRRMDILLSRIKAAGSIASYIFAIARFELSISGLLLLRGNVLSSFGYTVGVGVTLMMIYVADRSIRGYLGHSDGSAGAGGSA